jgi:hypothetical protein
MTTEDTIESIISVYHKPDIQISKHIVTDILTDIVKRYGRRANLLVFGAGHDTAMWINANKDGNTCVVEHDDAWFKKYASVFPENIIKHDFANITVESSLELELSDLERFPMPEKLNEQKWDVIIIDGPTGCNWDCPGRALPIYWAKSKLSHSNTIVYVDDCDRDVEDRFIELCFGENCQKRYYDGRYGTVRLAFYVQRATTYGRAYAPSRKTRR